jgi:hypothetical protein
VVCTLSMCRKQKLRSPWPLSGMLQRACPSRRKQQTKQKILAVVQAHQSNRVFFPWNVYQILDPFTVPVLCIVTGQSCSKGFERARKAGRTAESATVELRTETARTELLLFAIDREQKQQYNVEPQFDLERFAEPIKMQKPIE